METQDLFKIAEEIRGYVAGLKEEGCSPTVVRKSVVDSMDLTSMVICQRVIMQIASSPEVGFGVAFSIYEGLGGVNAVLLEEGLAPIHIKELSKLDEFLITAIEDYSEQTIDEVFTYMENNKPKGDIQ